MIPAALIAIAATLTAQAPDEFVAIRCDGTEKFMPAGTRTESTKPVHLTFILNEHDRSVSRWNEELSREEPMCAFEMQKCFVDFGPVLITIDSDLEAPSSIAATIDRRAGTYHSFVTHPAAHTSTLAECVQTALPKFDPATRKF